VLLTFVNARLSDSAKGRRFDTIRDSIKRSKHHTASIGDFLQHRDEVYSAQTLCHQSLYTLEGADHAYEAGSTDDASNIVSMSGGKLVFYSQDFFVDRVGYNLKLRLFHQDYRFLVASRRMTDHGCFDVNSRLAHQSSSPNN